MSSNQDKFKSRATYLKASIEQALANTSSMSICTDMLRSINLSYDKPYQLYPAGTIMQRTLTYLCKGDIEQVRKYVTEME